MLNLLKVTLVSRNLKQAYYLKIHKTYSSYNFMCIPRSSFKKPRASSILFGFKKFYYLKEQWYQDHKTKTYAITLIH